MKNYINEDIIDVLFTSLKKFKTEGGSSGYSGVVGETQIRLNVLETRAKWAFQGNGYHVPESPSITTKANARLISSVRLT